tara:strand:- start:3860 stop:5887 length:2028 start_codon:yes stop_codon:yes gene_type:complete
MQHIDEKPLIPAEVKIPEITIKAVLIAIVLTVLLAASNSYLGLKVGMTISTSIPAAVISMGILRMFTNHTVLENTMVQTAASCGQSAVSGIIFTVPALVLIHFWAHFNYLYTTLIAIIGGTLGILFSVPLRRVLLSDKALTFPEGVAIGNVLKVSAKGSGFGLKFLIQGGLVGALVAFCQNGLHVASEGFGLWFGKSKVLFGLGLGFTPALIAAGYIVGITAGISILFGIVVAWVIGMPILTAYFAHPAALHGSDLASWMWLHYIRYIGVGTLLVGGLWTIGSLFKPLVKGIKASYQAVHLHREGSIIRTEKDLPVNIIFWILVAMVVPLIFMLGHTVHSSTISFGTTSSIVLVSTLTVLILVLGFALAALCGYFSGLIGASSNPLSAMAVAAMLFICIAIYLVLPGDISVLHSPGAFKAIAAIAIVAVAIAASSGSISTDTSQDFKAGKMVGATPWKQQVMLIVGLVAGALVVAPILDLLFNAYGIGGVFPRAGMDPHQMLTAPQASLMVAITQGVFGGKLPWGMLITGMVIAAVTIAIDELIAKPRGKRMLTLAVGTGIYLPMTTSTCLVIGAFVSYAVELRHKKWKAKLGKTADVQVHNSYQRGVLLASGIVAGATLMGVALAIPFVIYKSSDALSIMPSSLTNVADVLGVVSAIFFGGWLYRVATHKKHMV